MLRRWATLYAAMMHELATHVVARSARAVSPNAGIPYHMHTPLWAQAGAPSDIRRRLSSHGHRARSAGDPSIEFSGDAMSLLFVNGQRYSVDLPGDTPLLWVLRDHLNMTGTKFGCGMALCGACTVLIDGAPTRSCSMPVSSLKPGVEITTIEGVKSKEGKAVQAAWEKLDVPQCGYCQSGQIMSATALLAKKKNPSDAEIDEAMSGNVCRCATYNRIRAAIHQAAKSIA
jgi:isoquinoline 1-oxidoreductase alpha subunit